MHNWKMHGAYIHIQTTSVPFIYTQYSMLMHVFKQCEPYPLYLQITFNYDFQCGICCRTFDRRSWLQRHMDGVHSHKRYPCLLCDKVFTQESSATRHRRHAHAIYLEPNSDHVNAIIWFLYRIKYIIYLQ